jgi:hypothetical protein
VARYALTPGYYLSPLRGEEPTIHRPLLTAHCLLLTAHCSLGAGALLSFYITKGFRVTTGHYFLRTTQFDIERWCCTTTVLNGSSHSPPRASVVAKSISSSTRKRVLPSGRR